MSFFGHGGDAHGYLAHFAYAPALQRGYFIVINAFNKEALRKMRQLIEEELVGSTSAPPASNAPLSETQIQTPLEPIGQRHVVSRTRATPILWKCSLKAANSIPRHNQAAARCSRYRRGIFVAQIRRWRLLRLLLAEIAFICKGISATTKNASRVLRPRAPRTRNLDDRLSRSRRSALRYPLSHSIHLGSSRDIADGSLRRNRTRPRQRFR